jgi:hypothetical protein
MNRLLLFVVIRYPLPGCKFRPTTRAFKIHFYARAAQDVAVTKAATSLNRMVKAVVARSVEQG